MTESQNGSRLRAFDQAYVTSEYGTSRIDTSEHVWFANHQLAVRFIEEIDFDLC